MEKVSVIIWTFIKQWKIQRKNTKSDQKIYSHGTKKQSLESTSLK